MRDLFGNPATSGAEHLGSDAGGFRQYVEDAREGDAFPSDRSTCTRSASTPHPHPRERTLDLLAIRSDRAEPERSTIFAQSHATTAHADSNRLLSPVASFGELRRMTQFKDKS